MGLKLRQAYIKKIPKFRILKRGGGVRPAAVSEGDPGLCAEARLVIGRRLAREGALWSQCYSWWLLAAGGVGIEAPARGLEPEASRAAAGNT